MIRLKGNSTYIKNVQAPTKLELKITSGMQGGQVVLNPGRYCFSNKVINLDLDPTAYINRTGDIITDMNDYIYRIFDNIISNCYNTALFNELASLLKSTYNEECYDTFINITQNLRRTLDDNKYIEKIFNTAGYSQIGLFSIQINHISFDFENGIMKHFFNKDIDSIDALFRLQNVFTNVHYNMDSSNRHKFNIVGGSFYYAGFKDIYNLLVNIFFFYAFQSRRNELMAGKMFELHAYCAHSSRRIRGEIYVWDNNLEMYMSYVPKKANKWVIGDLCNSITVNHDMSEGTKDFLDEFKSDGGEKYNPIERRKISFIQSESQGVSDSITFITMPPKRFSYYKQDVMLNAYNAYISYQNSNGGHDAVGVTLYTTNKSYLKSISINMINYSNKLEEYVLKNMGNIMLLSYDDLLFNSIQFDISNPDIEFKLRAAYFTKGGGRTFKNESDLVTAKIPKEKRDQIFAALCDLCYELDVEPQDVIDRLDVYFKKLYKKPTELL